MYTAKGNHCMDWSVTNPPYTSWLKKFPHLPIACARMTPGRRQSATRRKLILWIRQKSTTPSAPPMMPPVMDSPPSRKPVNHSAIEEPGSVTTEKVRAPMMPRGSTHRRRSSTQLTGMLRRLNRKETTTIARMTPRMIMIA